jgi:hypothetical protein
MSNLPTFESLAELTSSHQPPCLSLYQPTHRRHPEVRQDPILFRSLIQELEATLQQRYTTPEVRALLEPIEQLRDDLDFWTHMLDGLAVLSDRGLFRVFKFQQSVRPLARVADSFHLKPLRRFLQTGGRYQVLGLSLKEIHLFEGSRDVLDEVELAPKVTRTSAQALVGRQVEQHLTVSSYGGLPGRGGAPAAMVHGQASRKDEVDTEAELFFRAVDRGILQYHSRPSRLPLILAALPEHHDLFHKVSHNPFLVAEGVAVNPDLRVLPKDELRQRTWRVVESQYQARLASLVDSFAVAAAKRLASDDLTQVAEAAATGRVATLMIEAERFLPGRLDTLTGRIAPAEPGDRQADDLLDDLGELVTTMGGRVVVLAADQMPSHAQVAAIYRY